MKKLFNMIGKAGYWLIWPVLYVYLRFTTRTRVLIRHGDELLMVKGWLGDGSWSLPGGGLHHSEAAAQGAVREVYEETGITLDPAKLTYLFDRPIRSKHGLRYRGIAYGIELPQKPKLKQPKGEISDIKWFLVTELIQYPDAEYLLRPALERWGLDLQKYDKL